MMAWIDVENAHTNDVITYKVPLIKFEYQKEVIFDISSLNKKDLDILKLAIDTSKDTWYTDIELFFIGEDNCPNFGSDYDFKIAGNRLIGIDSRLKWYKEKDE